MSRGARGTGHALTALVATYCAHWLDLSLDAKVAPAVAASFNVPVQAMTYVFTASRLGMAAGALLGGLAADRWGRKRVLCLTLATAAALALLTPLIRDFVLFTTIRGLSGLLLGGAAPCALALVAELATERWRAMAVATTLAGAGIGSSIGSLLVYALPGPSHWPSIFIVCGLGVAATTALSAWWIDEPTRPAAHPAETAPAGLAGVMLGTSVILGLGFFASVGLNSLLTSWLPTFFHALADVPIQRFAGIAMFTTPVAAVGMLAAGWLSPHLSHRRLVALCFGLHALALALLGTLRFASAGFILALATLSFAQAACHSLLNLCIVARYPAALRATALGAAAALGRVGAVLAPAVGALALTAHTPLLVLFAELALVPLSVGLLIAMLRAPAAAARL